MYGIKIKKLNAYFDKEIERDNIVIELIFEDGFFYISVDSDDDTLNFSYSNIYGPDVFLKRDLSNGMPCKKFVGSTIRWFWLMENNQGYLDGIQFEFYDKNSGETAVIQFLAIASRIEIRLVSVFW